MTAPIPIDAALRDPALLGAALGDGSSWSTWISTLKAAFGRPLSRSERAAFDLVAGDRTLPEQPVRELWCVAGRRSGKSRIAAAISAYIATCVDHSARLSPGEVGMILTLAASRAQARMVHDYCKAFIECSPILRQRIEEITAEEIRLTGGIVIAVHSNSFRTVRGRTLLGCVFDELAYWRDEASATPDIETYRAVLPSLASTQGMLIGISSPYRRIGLLAQKHRDYFGTDSAECLVIQAATGTLNPTIDMAMIARARANDPQAGLAEWDAEFRSDLSTFLDEASIDAAINRGRPAELPPHKDAVYSAFVDMSGGRHDASCIGIVHRDGERIVLDVLRGRHGNPAAAVAEFSELAKQYGCGQITGDNYSADWVATAFESAGRQYVRSRLTRSELYLEGLPLFTQGLVSITDNAQLIRELRLLERRTARSGKDSVDHAAGGTDDHANVLFGAMHLATKPVEGVVCAAVLVTGPYGHDTLFSSPRWS